MTRQQTIDEWLHATEQERAAMIADTSGVRAGTHVMCEACLHFFSKMQALHVGNYEWYDQPVQRWLCDACFVEEWWTC